MNEKHNSMAIYNKEKNPYDHLISFMKHHRIFTTEEQRLREIGRAHV